MTVRNLGNGKTAGSGLLADIALEGLSPFTMGRPTVTGTGNFLRTQHGAGSFFHYDEDFLSNSGNVARGFYSGAYDYRCKTDPSCDQFRLRDAPSSGTPDGGDWSPAESFTYVAGTVTYRFSVMNWTPPTGVTVGQWFISGSNAEYYALHPEVTATPEPVTLTLLATGLAGVGLVRRRKR